jgi:two-component system nitrogen regulation sensor histidine kinase NtrY
MLRRKSLERRLFGWLLVLALLPPLAVLGGAVAVGAGWFEWLGTLGPWERVADSGRALIVAAAPAAENDSALAAAAARHERELSHSLLQASRWAFLGERLGAVLSIVAMLIALVLASAALFAARRLAQGLARPIEDLVAWSERMGRGEPLPPEAPEEASEVREVRTLRAALRRSSTEIAQGRERALEAARLLAWGELARRVAHEMKNPLTPLRLAAHRLAHAGEDAPIVREVAEVIAEETARLDEMARQFAALGRPPEGPPSEVDIAELMAGLIKTDVSPHLDPSLYVAPGTSTIVAHYDALLRAFRNLLRNAVESVEGKGGGSIEVRIAPVADGGVEVLIADDGAGFPAGLAERIFEPDFTLKAGGTGLGLAVVRQIVTGHGGDVRARTLPSGGAEFTVRLPAAPVRSVAA